MEQLEPCRSNRARPFLTTEVWRGDNSADDTITVLVANVPLKCSRMARMEAEVYNDLMVRGYSNQFFLKHNGAGHSYIYTTHPDWPRKTFGLARLITGGEAGTRVQYRNKNTRDLRRSNLIVGDGYSTGLEAAVLGYSPDDDGAF